MKRIHSVLTLATALLLCALARPQAHAFTHPCAPTTLQELDTIKANLDKEPWKSGYASLAADGKSQLGYVMGGPFEVVKRNPNENLWPWRNDMVAFYNLSRMWYFTGNPAYAQKAHDIIIAWATVHKVFGGNESGLDLGDYALCYGNGASILRGTWSGWTQQDTLTVQNYFRNVLWPATAAPYNVSGPANKGSLSLVAGAELAVFCDDTVMFNHVVDVFRNYPGSGLPNILPIGQMGETGRDMGHGFNDLLARTVTAEILWKQGVDVFSESDNRLLAAGEYHARNTSAPATTPFVPYGTVDYNYYQNSGAVVSQDRITYYILQNAYKNRFGLPTPWIDQKLNEAGVHGGNFMFAKTADFSTATPPPADPRPAVSPASSGLTLTTLGTQTAGRSASYANGVWTVTGLGGGAWSDTADDGQFVYTAMTGDCALVTQVTSLTYSGSQNGKIGLMIRDNLIGTVSQRAWISITPTASSGNLIEARATGWTVTWGGSNWARRSQGLPLPLPYWLKIERKDNVITSYTSQDGTSWSPTISSDYGNLPSTVYVGLFVSSGNTTPNTATFANLAFTGGTGGLVTTPAAPAAMLASGSGKAVTLRWLPSFGATAYDILRSTTSGSGYAVIASDLAADKTSYVDTSAAAGTTYYYVARAKNSAGTSGNSPEFSAARLTVPLINLAFDGGTVTDSANNSANAANAFDDDFGSQWFYGGTTGWLQCDFGANSAQVVKRYTLVSAPDFDTRDPKDWEFQGSNDGSAWTTLDAQANQAFPFRTYLRAFPLSNTTAYRYYRLNITSNNGDGAFVHLGGLGLWGDGGRVIPDGAFVLANRNSHKVMNVTGTTNGTPVLQQTFTGDDSQQWNLAWQGNGQYRATHVASAKVLDNGGTSTAGANLVIQPSSGATSQLWKLVPDADGFFRVESVNSGLVANVSGGSTSAGANIVQATYTGADSQLWMPGSAVAPQPAPSAPTSLSGTAVSISQINLSWTGSSSAVAYQLKRATTSGGPYSPVSAPVNTTSYSDTGLSSSTTYYYVVSAINGSGESANSAQATATTLSAPPDAPASPTAILGTNGVTLSWTASGGATGYTVQRATTSVGPYTTVASGLTGTTYTDTSISHDTTYYYIVVATNANGSSPASSEITVGSGTLVAQLKFDETGGTLATDSSGRGQNATLVNGANFAAAGMVESGLNLPATAGQHATLPSGIVSGLTDFTIATWIKVNAFSTWARIFDFGTGTNNNMFLAAQGSAGAGRPRFSIRTTSVAEQVIDSSVALTAGTWAHVAVTRSGSTVSIYINGSLAGSGTITASPADLGFTTQNYLGKSQFTDPALNATLDDFRIYATALNSSELAALANPAAGAPTRVAATPGNTQANVTWLPNATTGYTYTVKRSTTSGGSYTTVATGLTALTYTDTGLTNDTTYYYVVSATNGQNTTPDSAEVSTVPNTLAVRLKFDESSGTVAADSSGRNFNATLVNGPVFAAGVMANGLSLTSTSSQYATLPSGVVSGMTDFTVATWVKVNAFATWQRIFDFGSATNNYMFLTTQYTTTAPNAAKLRYGIKVNGGTEQNVSGTSIALTAGTWTHVAVTRSGTTVSIYVNGSLAGSGTLTAKPSDLGTTTLNYLGKSQFNDPYLNASLDEFRIYSRALSSSEIVTMATVLPAPSGLAATAGTGQVALSWSSVSGASGYNVKRATTSGGPYTTIKADNASASFTDTTAANGTTYYYVVSATNLGGESPDSAQASATPLAPPAVPAGLTAVAGDATISLDWSASTGADSYTVKRATAPGGPYTTLASGVTGTSYDDNDLPSGTTYYYVVSAVNAVSESANSTEVSATTIPATPTGLTTTPGNGQVALSWNAATGASSYTILRSTNVNGPFTAIATGVTGTSYADTTALPGWTYYYALSAGNASGDSASSASVTITAATAALSWLKLDETSGTTAADATGNTNTGALLNAPAWLGGRIGNALNLNGTNQYVSLPASVTSNLHDFTVSAWVYWNGGGNWQRIFDFGRGTTVNMFLTPKNGANGFPRFVITTSGAGGEQQINTTSALTTGVWHHMAITLSGSTGTLYIDGQQVGQNTGLTLRPSDLGATTQNWIGRSQYTADPYLNGRVDDFRLYAGALSSAEIAALAAPIQTTGLATTGGSGQIALTWTATSGATSYTVRRATTTGGASTVVVSGLTGTSYTNTGLAAGTTYYYVVTPANASGDGANSAEASTMTTPAAPGNVTATPGNGQVTLTWSASTGATGYSVLRATSPNGSYTTVATGITGTSYTDTGLANGTTYYYAIVAANGSGSSANSTQVNAVTAPPAPAGLSANGWNGAVNLAWTASSGATSYTVKRATTSGGAYTTLASGVASTTYSDTTATNGTTYYYVVSATNAAGESANSAEASATFTQPLVHLKFDETSGTSAADSSGNGWTGTLVNGPLWSAGRAANSVDLDGTNDHVTLPTGVVNGLTTCTITLWANLDSISNWSRLFDFGTGTTVNMFLTPKNGANSKIRFGITTGGGNAEQRIDGAAALPIGGWHHVAVTLNGSTGTLYVDGVQVGQNTAMTLTPSSLGSTTLNRIGRSQYNDPYLMGRIDEFRIYGRALSAAELASLMAASPAGLVSAPAALTATAGTGQVALNWSAVTGATSYDVLRSTTSGGPYLDVATGLTTTTYTNTGLTAGTTYYYVIVARTATSESPNSPVASATAQ